MTKLPKKCLVDTNVPVTANKVINPLAIPAELVGCVQACVNAIQHVVTKGGLVLDSQNEIFDEYRRHLQLLGQPGPGDHFVKWVHDNRWKFPELDRVEITKNGESYDEFPDGEELSDFDPSDRKFVAVANAHPKKPSILQATDSKWWGHKEALKTAGIRVLFLCTSYVKMKYAQKMKT